MLKKTALFLAVLLVAAPSLMAEDLTLDQILEKNIEARGGADAWESVKSAKIEGTMVMGGAMEMPVTMTFKRPNMIHFQMEMQGQKIVQAYDGTSGWQVMPMMGNPDPQKMSDEESKNVRRQSDFEGPLYNYKEKGHQVELVGKEDVEGTEAYKIKITLKSGDVVHSYIDSEYFLEFKQVYEINNAQTGQDMTMNTLVGDYKEAGPILLAHSMEMVAEGAPQGMSIIFNTVEVNVDVDDAFFTMPEAKEAPAAAADGGR